MRKGTRISLLCSALALAGASAAPAAHAQSSADKAAAEAVFQTGRDLMSAGKFAEACKKFEASQRLDAGLGTLLFLADCYEKANRLASAWALFREAESIAMGRSDQGRAQVAKERYASIEPRLSKVWIKVAEGNDPSMQVTRDGEPVPRESWGIALPTDAGDHTIEAKAAGRKTWSAKVVVAREAEDVPVEVPVLEAAPEAPKAAPAPTPAPSASPARDQGTGSVSSTQRTLAFVVGGVGIVGLGVGSYFGLHAKSRNTSSIADCSKDNPNLCSAQGLKERNEALTAARTATVFMVGGGALLAGGVVLYLTAPSATKSARAPSGLEVAAGATPDGGRVTLGGTW
jgi:tetratricopeptide (TPR) repeat protein